MDWGHVALAMLFIAFRLLYIRHVYQNEIVIPTQQYEGALEEASELVAVQQTIAAVFLMLAVIRLFKYFQFQDKMRIINKTFAIASGDLFHFLVLFFLVFFAFVVLAFVLFGAHIDLHSSFGRAMQTMVLTERCKMREM